MAKISTYPLEGNPKLSDKLIGTSVGLNQIGNLENPTYNFSLQQLLDLFSPLLPGNTLQGVLDNNNTATQDINLFGTITTEDLEVTNIANIFSAYISDSLYIEGELFDKNNSQGTVGQILTSTGDGIEWITPSNVIPTLQEVLTSGNIADLDMNLSANIFAEDIDSNNLSAQDSFQLYGSFIDSNGSSGSLGQMLISLGNSVQWQDVPVYTASSPLSINSITRNITIQQANGTQNGYLSYADWINFDGKQNALSGTGIVVSDGGTITYITNNSYDWNRAFNDNIVSVSVTGLSTKTITLTQRDGDTLVANWNDDGGGGGGIASVGLIMPAAFNVLNSPLTADGDIEVEAAGDANQYIKGDGTLGTFPTIGNYVPYTGATQDVDLGSNDLTANSIIKNGGTSSQFLKADGSIDSSSYITLASLLATSPLIYNELTGTFSIQQSNSTQGGYLSSNDWNTFNGKQDSGNYITDLTGEATASGPGAASVVLNNAAVIAKVLTGLNITGGSVVSTDNILEAFGKLQNQINALISGSAYQGVWNADTNTPALASGVGSNGEYYVVNVAGSTNLDGITDWNVGDWAIFHDTSWQKVDNTDSVSSVNGQVGAVNLTTDNIPEGLTNLYFTDARARLALSFAAGSGAYNNATGQITIPTDNSQILNGAGYITSAALAPYLLISTAASTYYPIPTGTTSQYVRGDGSLATFPGLTGFVPYTGATANLDLGTHTLLAADLVINHTSGSGVAASITKNGSGEALTVVKGSGSGNAASITGGVTLISELHLTTDLADAYISSAAVWNAKQNAINLTTVGNSGPATFNGTDLNIPEYTPVTIGTANGLSLIGQQLSLGLSGSSTNGALSSIDWNTFNNKFTLPTLTSGSVLFSNGTTIAQDNANLFWDNTNNRLVIGFNTPINNSRLLVVGDDYQITLASTNGLTGIFCSDQSVPMISLDSNANLWNAFNNTIQYNVSDKYFNLKKIIISDLGQSTILGAEKMPNGASFTTASEETLIGVYDNTTTYWETGIYAKRNIYCGAYDTTTILTIAPPNSSVDLVAKIGYGSRFFIAKVSVMVDWNALNYTYKITSTNTTRDDDSDSLNVDFEFAFSGAEFVIQIKNNSGNDIYPNINANIS
jgi:hypothetical protein